MEPFFLFYILYFYKKHGKIVNKEMILYTIITLVIPCICGFLYTILPSFQNANSIKATNQITLEGYIYRNLFSNLLLFIPFLYIT